MSGHLVPTVRTTYTTYDIIKALIQGWSANEGSLPNKRQIGVIWAQNALETGQSTSMWNNNIANVKYTAAAGDVDYCQLANVGEMVKGIKIVYQPPHPATWFRSFKTLADGVTFQINFLKNARYKNSWSAVQAGNPAAFAHLLKIAGYYTASEQDYVNAINTYFNKYMKDTNFEKALAEVQKVISMNSIEPGIAEPEPVSIPEVTIVGNPTIWDQISAFFASILKKFKK